MHTLVTLRNIQLVKNIICDNSFWKKRTEMTLGVDIPENYVLSSWYNVYKFIENGKPEELLYSDDPDIVRFVQCLDRLGIAKADHSKGYQI
jgi:hypothetical protein